MIWRSLFVAPLLALAGCATQQSPVATSALVQLPPGPVEVQILGINDFHGNLEPPTLSIETVGTDAAGTRVPAGGVAFLATAAKTLRAGKPHSVTLSAGDMIGGTPLVSALFLDEPAIQAMEQVGVEYNAVGNHEFDKGSAELVRMQRGGCDKHTNRQPCAVEPYDGAAFGFLAANVLTASGQPLFPGSAIKDFGPVQLGIIGMTLKETATLVTPSGVSGLTFADEATTANAAVPQLKAAGADAIVLLIHQGARTTGAFNDATCPGLSGDILPILARLDPAIEVVVSGHTHAAYACTVARPGGGKPLLLTSAGRYGTMITDIRLTIDPAAGITARRAENVIVQGAGFTSSAGPVATTAAYPVFPADPATAALVERYVLAAKPQAERVVATLGASLSAAPDKHGGRRLGELIADSQLAWTRPKKRGGAEIAFMNGGGVRADLMPGPGGRVTYAQLFALQPFGNGLVVQTLTGAQIKRLLEQQFASGTNSAARPNMLLSSEGFAFRFDLTRPAGERIVAMTLRGKPIDSARRYRVTTNSFLASGGDNFTVLKEGGERVDAGVDLDALESWLKRAPAVPTGNRVRNVKL